MKNWYRSKTIIVAILQALLGIVVAFATEYPGVGLFLFAKSLLDIVLRFVTEEPIR